MLFLFARFLRLLLHSFFFCINTNNLYLSSLFPLIIGRLTGFNKELFSSPFFSHLSYISTKHLWVHFSSGHYYLLSRRDSFYLNELNEAVAHSISMVTIAIHQDVCFFARMWIFSVERYSRINLSFTRALSLCLADILLIFIWQYNTYIHTVFFIKSSLIIIIIT